MGMRMGKATGLTREPFLGIVSHHAKPPTSMPRHLDRGTSRLRCRSSPHQFEKVQLTDRFWRKEPPSATSTTMATRMSLRALLVGRAGFATRHTYYPDHRGWQQKQKDGSTQTVQGYEGALGTKNTYSDNFFAFSHDFNGDGWDDILILGVSLEPNPPGMKTRRGKTVTGRVT